MSNKAKAAEQKPVRHDPFQHVGDPHWGKGGRYVVDKTTGQRVPDAPPADNAPTETAEE